MDQEAAQSSVKPRISYADLRWQEAFKRVISLGVRARFYDAAGNKYTLKHWNPDPENAFAIFRMKDKSERIVRRGDVLMLELKPHDSPID